MKSWKVFLSVFIIIGIFLGWNIKNKIIAEKALNNQVVKISGSSSQNLLFSKSIYDFAVGHEILNRLPSCLKGTTIPDNLEVDAKGNLVINKGILILFNYFNSTFGELDGEEINTLIASYLLTNLSGKAAEEAWSIYQNLMTIQRVMAENKVSITGFPKNSDEVSALQEYFKTRHDMREDYLGNEVSRAFYEDDELYDQYSLSRLSIVFDKSLTDEERRNQLEELENMLPEDMKKARKDSAVLTNLSQKISSMKESGYTDEQIHEYRVSELGKEAAERFKELDLKQGLWDSQYANYRQMRQEIISNPELSSTERESRIRELQDKMFKPEEIKRVAVLDRIKN